MVAGAQLSARSSREAAVYALVGPPGIRCVRRAVVGATSPQTNAVENGLLAVQLERGGDGRPAPAELHDRPGQTLTVETCPAQTVTAEVRNNLELRDRPRPQAAGSSEGLDRHTA